jgi:hypothetical protein
MNRTQMAHHLGYGPRLDAGAQQSVPHRVENVAQKLQNQ